MLEKHIAVMLSVFLLCGCGLANTAEPTPKENAMATAEALIQATLRLDYEKIADHTNPAVVKMMGGRKEMITGMTAMMDDLKEKGMVFVSMTMDKASDPVAAGDELYIVMTYKAVMTLPKGKLHGKSYLLGISTDKGKTWTLVDGAAGEEMIRELLTNLPKELKLPAEEKMIIKDPE